MSRWIKSGVIVCLVTGIAIALFFTRDQWMPLLKLGETAAADDESAPVAAGPQSQQVVLSPQAQRNLALTSAPLKSGIYWKTIDVPGRIVDRPGISDRGVVAPVTAIVIAVHHYAGDTVQPGEPLFTLRLVGESFQTSQTELFKAIKDREIAEEQIDRLDDVAAAGGIAGSRLIELRNTVRRLDVSINAYRQDLQIRGLSAEQINEITQGNFVSEVVVQAPEQDQSLLASVSQSLADLPAYELQELSVELGQQVQAGQRLCTLSHHLSLFVEGQAFRQELPLLQDAAESGLPIAIELVEDSPSDWETPLPSLAIHHISNNLDEDNRTISFFLTLQNQFRTYQRAGQKQYLWRFRPGQRVRLKVNVEKLDGVFVVPAEAVVQEGPEFFVFRHNGDTFDRKPVHVVHRTQNEVVIANDGSVPAGIFVAQVGAAQLNRVLKSQTNTSPAGMHVHADGSVHADH